MNKTLNAPRARPAVLRRLADPLAGAAPGTTAVLAAVTVAASVLLAARAGVRFDGPLRVYAAGGPVSPRTALADQLSAFVVPSLLGWVALRASGVPARLGRVASGLGAARLPLVLASPLAIVFARSALAHRLGTGAHPDPTPLALAAGLVAALAFVYAGVLSVAGLRAAAGGRGGRLALAVGASFGGGQLVHVLGRAWLG